MTAPPKLSPAQIAVANAGVPALSPCPFNAAIKASMPKHDDGLNTVGEYYDAILQHTRIRPSLAASLCRLAVVVQKGGVLTAAFNAVHLANMDDTARLLRVDLGYQLRDGILGHTRARSEVTPMQPGGTLRLADFLELVKFAVLAKDADGREYWAMPQESFDKAVAARVERDAGKDQSALRGAIFGGVEGTLVNLLAEGHEVTVDALFNFYFLHEIPKGREAIKGIDREVLASTNAAVLPSAIKEDVTRAVQCPVHGALSAVKNARAKFQQATNGVSHLFSKGRRASGLHVRPKE